MEPLYEDRRRDDTFLARPQPGRASAGPSYNTQPEFTSLLPDGLGGESNNNGKGHHLDFDSGFEHSFSKAGAELIRSQSAAPTFHGTRNTLFPPPGLGNIKETTPSTVDSYSSSHSNFESSAVDHRGADIMQLGQRRPASTGVLHSDTGLYGISPKGGAVRPAAKTLMELIQEDNTTGEINQRNKGGHQDSFDSYSREEGSYGSNRHPQQQQQQQQLTSPHMSSMSPQNNQQPYMQYSQQQLPTQQYPPHHHQQQPQPQPQYMQHDNRMQQPRPRGPYDNGAAPFGVSTITFVFDLRCVGLPFSLLSLFL